MRQRLSILALPFVLPLVLAWIPAAPALAAPGPYDESADAQAQIAAALRDAAQAKVSVLVVFGANWCADCKVLDLAFKEGAAAPLIAKSFKVVKVDVGRFDRNTDIAQRYGVPLKAGIPAVAVLDAQGRVVYATKAGELADARQMGSTAIHAFFTRVAAGAGR
jgi:protein disulfide-isomerase